ncbi:MAG: hypothetical protein U1U88_000639 [Lawsonella clevelandensis]
MIPGASMYRFIYFLNVGDLGLAARNLMDAGLVVIAIGAGLAIARMVTDPSGRTTVVTRDSTADTSSDAHNVPSWAYRLPGAPPRRPFGRPPATTHTVSSGSRLALPSMRSQSSRISTLLPATLSTRSGHCSLAR